MDNPSERETRLEKIGMQNYRYLYERVDDFIEKYMVSGDIMFQSPTAIVEYFNDTIDLVKISDGEANIITSNTKKFIAQIKFFLEDFTDNNYKTNNDINNYIGELKKYVNNKNYSSIVEFIKEGKYTDLLVKINDVNNEITCSPKSIKWENNNCAVDSLFMALLYPIHPYTYQKLIVSQNKNRKLRNINGTIKSIHNSIYSGKSCTTSNLRNEINKQCNNCSPAGDFSNISDYIHFLTEKYNFDIYYLKYQEHSVSDKYPEKTKKHILNGIIDISILLDIKLLSMYDKYINITQNYNITQNRSIAKNNLIENISNGILILKISENSYNIKVKDQYTLPDTIANKLWYYNTGDNYADVIFDLHAIIYTKSFHTIAYIKCNNVWYYYNFLGGQPWEKKVNLDDVIAEIQKTKQLELTFIYTAPPKVPYSVYTGLKYLSMHKKDNV